MSKLENATIEFNGTSVNLSDIISEDDCWVTGRSRIIGYEGIKKIADHFGIVVKETPFMPCVPVEGNRQQHIRAMWLGLKGDDNKDNWIFSEGEASQLNTGALAKTAEGKGIIQERGIITSEYKSTMAYKRAYCRGIIRMTKLYGFYTEVEAETFKKGDVATETDYSAL